MIRPTAYCDECGRAKGESNHWFRALSMPGQSFLIKVWSEGPPIEGRHAGMAVNEQGEVVAEIHLCSESCAIKAMAKAIGSTAGEENG